jgi:hypothetical protein
VNAERADVAQAAPPTTGLFVSTAVKLWAVTGEWPWWFVHVVGEDVPRGYVMLGLAHRQDLELELGLTLPVIRAPQPVTRPRMTQIGLHGAGPAARPTAGSARGAA